MGGYPTRTHYFLEWDRWGKTTLLVRTLEQHNEDAGLCSMKRSLPIQLYSPSLTTAYAPLPSHSLSSIALVAV